jgi:HEAT repeat protein
MLHYSLHSVFFQITLWLTYAFIASNPNILLAESSVNRSYIPYLMQKNQCAQAIDLYRQLQQEQKKHDFEILEQLGTIILEKGAESSDPETQLLTLYGSSRATLSLTVPFLAKALKSQHPQTQLAAMQLLGQIDDDRCASLLKIAMSSAYFYTRMEAAFQLCVRKDRHAVGQIEALMYRVPPPLRPYFPLLFGIIDTPEGTRMLKRLLNDHDPAVRIEAILSSAKNKQEDLLPLIRTLITHNNTMEQEACSFALGTLKDSSSIPLLTKLSTSHDPYVALTAAFALVTMGQGEAKEIICNLAKKNNLFAIYLLGDIPGMESLLISMLHSDSIHVRVNVLFSLIKLRSPKAIIGLREFVIHDLKDLGFYPLYSPGKALRAWKVVPSMRQHIKESSFDLAGLSISLRENLLKQAIELPEADFLHLAKEILLSHQTELVPSLMLLLENLRTTNTINLLKDHAQNAGSLLIRSYCNLALFRLAEPGPYEVEVKRWLKQNMGKELIRFRPLTPPHLGFARPSYELTPEELSRFLLEGCEALAHRQCPESIDLILEMIEKGNPKNRFALAGFLLKTIQ